MTSESWIWGPTMTQTFENLSNGLKATVNGKSTLLEALEVAEKETVSAMKSQAIEVSD